MKSIVKKDWQIFCDVGSNHNGDLDRAKQIIREVAKLNGVVGNHFKGVKFQLFRAAWLWAPSEYSPEKADVKKKELPREWVPELIKEGRKNKIAVGFSAFDDVSLAHLLDYGPSVFFKISSFDLLRLDFIRRCAVGAQGGNHPLHIATGGSSISEIDAALEAIYNETPGISVILYHCVSKYPLCPCDAEIYNMCKLDMLARKYSDRLNIVLGWSDHTRNIGTVCRSMSIYGDVAEVHVDLNDCLGWETQHGHVWTISELMELGAALRGFHDCMEPQHKKDCEEPDLRADPFDGLRPRLSCRSDIPWEPRKYHGWTK